jgi:hypothetical protein
VKFVPRVLPPLEIVAKPFPRYPALPGPNALATGLELSLALCSSEAPTSMHTTYYHDAATVSGLLCKALETVLKLSCIKVKNRDAAGAAVSAVAVSGSDAFLPLCP